MKYRRELIKIYEEIRKKDYGNDVQSVKGQLHRCLIVCVKYIRWAG